MGSRSRIHKLPTRIVDLQTAPTQKHSREKDKGWTTRSARPRAHTSGGSADATPSSREDVQQLSLSRPGPAPRRRASRKALPPALAGREAGARSLPFPSARGGGEGAGRGGARSRAACSRTSPGFGCVRPAARPLPPPPPPRFPFAGRRLRGAGASRRRDAAGVHRPPELPSPGARCGALL